jgi:predicted transport protein
MAIFKISGENAAKIKIAKFRNEKELQTLIEKNLETIFGIRFLYSEYPTTHGGRMDTLGLDENNSPVIFEYKKLENENIINQGLFYLDWLVDHRGDFQVLVQKKLGQNVKVNWDNPRIILIANSFNKYDIYAVNRISENIELKKYILYENGILYIEDVELSDRKKGAKKVTKHEFRTYDLSYHLKKIKDKNVLDRVNELREDILKIDESIKEHYSKDHIIFKTTIAFCSIYCQQRQFWVDIKLNRKEIKVDGLDIRPHKDEVWTHIRIQNETDLNLILDLAKKAYESTL